MGKRARRTEEQIVSILREAEQMQITAREVCRRNGISEQTYHRWKAKYGGMDVGMVRQTKSLELENTELKRLLGEQTLLIAGLKNALSKNTRACTAPGSCGGRHIGWSERTEGL